MIIADGAIGVDRAIRHDFWHHHGQGCHLAACQVHLRQLPDHFAGLADKALQQEFARQIGHSVRRVFKRQVTCLSGCKVADEQGDGLHFHRVVIVRQFNNELPFVSKASAIHPQVAVFKVQLVVNLLVRPVNAALIHRADIAGVVIDGVQLALPGKQAADNLVQLLL